MPEYRYNHPYSCLYSGDKVKINSHLPIQNRKYDKAALQLLVGITSILLLPQANAAEVTKDIIVGAGMQYDSNPALRSTQKDPVWIYSITPEFLLNVNDEVNHGYLDAAVLVERHSNEKVLVDDEYPRLTVGWDRTYESGMYGINADYIESSARAAELTSTGVFNAIGSVEKTKQVAAHWQHAINSRWSVLTEAAYHDISFTQSASTQDYTLGEIGSKLAYANTEKLDTYVRLAYSHFRTDNIFDDTDLVRLAAGANYKINESLNVGGRIGAVNLSGGQSGTDWEGGVKAEYVAERSNYSASLDREFKPSVSGGFQVANVLSLGWLFNATEKDQFGANYSYFIYNADKDINLTTLHYQEAGVFYDRKLTSHWKSVVSATRKELLSSGVSNRGNLVGVTLVFDTLNF
jgi:hypothetical protein